LGVHVVGLCSIHSAARDGDEAGKVGEESAGHLGGPVAVVPAYEAKKGGGRVVLRDAVHHVLRKELVLVLAARQLVLLGAQARVVEALSGAVHLPQVRELAEVRAVGATLGKLVPAVLVVDGF